MLSKVQKILGFVLLMAGLAIIVLGLHSSFQIFTAKNEAPEIFKIQSAKSVTQTKSASPITGMLDIDVEKILGGELAKIIPADYLPKLLNLFSWSIFTGVLFFGGSQLAGLGIKLLKN